MVEPSHIFYPVSQDSMFVYYQVYSLNKNINGDYPYEIEYSLVKDAVKVRSWEIKSTASSNTATIQSGISLKDLPFGLYDLR